jgi:hypothetical protein
MRTGTLTLMVLVLATTPSTGALQLELRTGMPEQLPYVYPDLRLALVNSSSRSAFLPRGGFYVQTSLGTADGWRECSPTVLSRPGLNDKVEWDQVPAGDMRAIPVPATRCLCRETSSSKSCKDWTDTPGQYRVKLSLIPYPGITGGESAPAGALTGRLESNVLEFRVKEPQGLDDEAIAWTKGSPMTVETLKAFPSSEYAALIWYRTVRLDDADPRKTRSLVDAGRYPGPNSIPTIEGSWKDLDSAGVARSHVEWGLRVLREHPQFPYRDEVKLIVALGQISLGEKQQGLRTVEALSHEHTTVGDWSRKFLNTVDDPGM